MKYTLLDLTQTILSSLDGDEVNSISDTVESMQVATVIRTAYFDLIDRAKLPEHYSLVRLDASGDTDLPVVMYMDEDLSDIKWLKYDCIDADGTQSDFRLIEYKNLDAFLEFSNQLDSEEDNVATLTIPFNGTNFTYRYLTDKAPEFYTSVEDGTFLFDSFDEDVDTTLQSSKTQCYCRKPLTFELEDDFIPTLDEDQFPLLLNEAKSLAWFELKQAQHAKAERAARRGWTSLNKNKNRSVEESDFDSLPNFGRK